ncbi:MAG TPA: PQQ-dependent sugar dehydrogenase, partial [Actinomycetota bacterium]
ADGNVGARRQRLLRLPEVSPYHDGGDIAFGPDGMLYVVTGEAHSPERAQDPEDVAGKVLRLEPDGSIPDNPLPGPVFSMGHRNSFGVCVDAGTGNVWQTENGPSANDEVNLIEAGGNFGWPAVQGAADDPRFVDPEIDFVNVVVPTGCAVYPHDHLGPRSEGALFFGDYGGTLWRAVLDQGGAGVERHHRFMTGLGGITDILVGPDERLYVVTNERILRLPAEIPSPEPSPSSPPSPGTSSEPEPTIDIPLVPSSEDGGIPWLLLAGVGILIGALAAMWFARRGPT